MLVNKHIHQKDFEMIYVNKFLLITILFFVSINNSFANNYYAGLRANHSTQLFQPHYLLPDGRKVSFDNYTYGFGTGIILGYTWQHQSNFSTSFEANLDWNYQ